MNDEDQEMADLEEWLAILKQSSDEDFTVQVRPYFSDTATMNAVVDEYGRDTTTEIVAKRYKGKHRS